MATVTLRPTGAGAYTFIDSQYPAVGSHYTKVNEVTADDDSTYVSESAYTSEYDLYTLTQVALSGTINSVTAWIRCTGSPVSYMRTIIRTESTNYEGSGNGASSYTDFSTLYTTNPYTGLAWTWTQINALQAGVKLGDYYGGETRCTQVWVVVDYTPSGWSNISEIDGIASSSISHVDDIAVASISEVNGVAV